MSFHRRLTDFKMPSTIEEYQELLKEQVEDSGTSETKKKGKQKPMSKLVVRFPPNPKETKE